MAAWLRSRPRDRVPRRLHDVLDALLLRPTGSPTTASSAWRRSTCSAPAPPASPPSTSASPRASCLTAADDERVVRRREQEADLLRAAAARHRQRRADVVHRHEAELPRGVGVAAAGDEHRAEPAERRVARAPAEERLERMDGAAGAVLRDRARVGERRPLGLAQRRRVARRARVGEQRAEGRLDRARGSGATKSCRRIAVPPAFTGNAFRQSRSASPSPR